MNNGENILTLSEVRMVGGHILKDLTFKGGYTDLENVFMRKYFWVFDRSDNAIMLNTNHIASIKTVEGKTAGQVDSLLSDVPCVPLSILGNTINLNKKIA